MKQHLNPKKFLILVVDDVSQNLQIIGEILEEAGYETTFATSGKQAIERVQTAQPNLILLDLMMPEMDGLEVCTQLKANPAYSSIPIIFLTASQDKDYLVKAFQKGAADYLTKPFHWEEVLARVSTHLLNQSLQVTLNYKNEQLANSNEEIKNTLQQLQEKNEELANTLQQLKATQEELIEKEKVVILAQSDRKFRAIFNQTFQFTGILNSQGIILEANQAALDFWELQLKDVVGKPLWECDCWNISPENKTQLQVAIAQAVRGKFIRYEVDLLDTSNQTATIDFSIKPIFDESSKLEYLIVEGRDITEQKQAEAERQRVAEELLQLNEALSRFVPRQFLHFLGKESIRDVQLGDQIRQEMSVLFADIRNFTTLSETMTPEDNFKFINSYLSCLGPAIREHQGFIDKYIGDGIMALFNGVADNAVKAGIAMLQQLKEYNQQRLESGYMPIKIGIGINTGELMLGTVGEQNRMDTTVISDAVNLASRLEGLSRNYEVPLLISHHTFSRLQNPADYALRMIDAVRVKGKSEKVIVYEVFEADLSEVKARKLATAEIFAKALSLYLEKNHKAAGQLFQELLKMHPGDKVAQVYLKNCTKSKICLRS